MCFLVKYALFISNLVFTLAGLTVVILGIVVLVFIRDLNELTPIPINAIPISLIVIGVVIFLLAFFGCFGAIRENRFLLSIYAICMLLIAAGNIYLVVVLFSALSSIHDSVIGWLGSAFNNNNLRNAYHGLEIAFKCCGTTGPDSYNGILPQLPPSCCPPSSPEEVCNRSDAFNGCNNIVGDVLETYITAIGSVITVIIIVALSAVILGLCLCMNIGNKQRRAMA